MKARVSFLALLLVVLMLGLVVEVVAEIPACNTHPLHAESSYTLEAPWKKADGDDPRTWDVYFDHDQYEQVPKEELGSGSFFSCPHLKQKQTCCGYSTYMHMKKQVVQMYELFFNETMMDLDNYTKRFDDMLNTFADTIKTALLAADNAFDGVDTKGVNEVISYIMMFVSRIWSVAYEANGLSRKCIANWMVYYASMWCLSCDQEDFAQYIKGGTLQVNQKDLSEYLGKPCGQPIVQPLMTLTSDFLEMIMKLIDPNTWWYTMLGKASDILDSSLKNLAGAIVGAMMSLSLAGNMNGGDLSYLVKKGGGNFTLEAFGPLSIGVFIYDIMNWIDESLFGWVPSSVKRQAGWDVAAVQSDALTENGEIRDGESWAALMEDHPFKDVVRPHPAFAGKPFAGTHTLLYNTVLDFKRQFDDSTDPEIIALLRQADDYASGALGMDDVAVQSDLAERNAILAQGVKADGAPDVSVAAVETGGYPFYSIGLNTGYFPEINAGAGDGSGGSGINVNITNTAANNNQSTFSGTEYLAAAAVTLMIMGSCAQGKRSAAKAAAKNLKKKRSGKAKSGMDRLLEERKKTKLSTEAKHNLLATPTTSQFDAFLERTGGSVSKHNKVELISEELRRPTGRAQSGPPRPSEGTRERMGHMSTVIEQQKGLQKVRAF